MSKIFLIKLVLLGYAAVGFAYVLLGLITKKKLNGTAKAFLFSLMAMGGIWFWGYRIEPYWIQVHPVVIHDAALAKIIGDLKIVHITDIHMGDGIRFREKQLIQKVNRLKPDLIFFTGDIIDDESQVAPAVELFSSLKASIGIYGVPGDTDLIFMNSKSLARVFANSGMRMLVNENVEVQLPNEQTLRVAGIEQPEENYLRQALKGIPYQAPYVLLSPSPDIFPAAVREKANLLLAGDTHGGQIGIEFLVRLSEYAYRTPYIKGFFHRDQTSMYVNRGIGTKTRNVRFLCPPEIAVIEVKP